MSHCLFQSFHLKMHKPLPWRTFLLTNIKRYFLFICLICLINIFCLKHFPCLILSSVSFNGWVGWRKCERTSSWRRGGPNWSWVGKRHSSLEFIQGRKCSRSSLGLYLPFSKGRQTVWWDFYKVIINNKEPHFIILGVALVACAWQIAKLKLQHKNIWKK